MKINNKKIIVSTLALAMGAALAGSISGSVAWYQYSTRATTQLSGTSAGTSRSLKVATSDLAKDNAGWGYNIKQSAKNEMAPTAAVIDANGVVTGFKEHPVYQYFTTWNNSDEANYFAYSLYFESLDEEGNREALPLYLTGYEFNASADNIVKEAIRVQLVPYTTTDGSNWVKGTVRNLSNTAGTTVVADYLDLNNNGVLDTNGFAADDSTGVAQLYKAGTATEYETVAFDDIKANDTDPYAFTDTGNPLVTTSASYNVRIDVKVWIEGWQKEATAGSKVLPVGTDTTGYYSDDACTTPSLNYHSVDANEGDSGVGLFTDTGCSSPAPNPLTADGTYYAKGADGSATHYFKDYIWDNSTIDTVFNLGLRFGVEAER